MLSQITQGDSGVADCRHGFYDEISVWSPSGIGINVDGAVL